MRAIARDFSFALRTLRKSPVFALTAIATIALGIGATTAIFSIVNAVLLRPLPYGNRDRLAFVTSDLTARGVSDFWVPPGDLADLRREVTAFDEAAMVNTFQFPLEDERGEAQMIRVASATTNLLRTLGVNVMLGRDFVPEEGTPLPPPPETPPGVQPAPPPPVVAILTHEFWQRQFGADRGVVGNTVRLGNASVHIVGVLEPGVRLHWFESANIESQPDMFFPLRVDFETASRINAIGRIVARLRPGATFAQAQEQVNALVTELRERFPIKETAGVRWRVEPMHPYLVATTRQPILTLMGAVLFVLLIACANVANLLLVRTSQRGRELAVRSALGGSRGSLVRQMLVESLVIAGAGALAGVALASGGIDLLRVIGPRNLPRLDQVSLDPAVLGFAVTAAVLSALAFGILPALRASRVDVADILRTGGRSGGLAGMGRWLRTGVVTAAVALAFVLLIGSGLMMRSFATLVRAEPGYDPAGLLTFNVGNTFEPAPEARDAAKRRLRDALGAIPGVTGVTAVGGLPLEGSSGSARWGPEEALNNPALFQQADTRVVLPGYFEVLRTRLLDGRVFTDADNTLNQTQVVVDDVFAAKAFPGVSAVGKQFVARVTGDQPTPWQIIGVVRHQRNTSLSADGRETIYFVNGTFGFGGGNTWVLRTNGEPARLAPAARAAVREVNARYLVNTVRPMTDLVDAARGPTRFALVCIGIFAVVAAVLASVGLYGVLATVVRQRTAEIGVRMAFGATGASVFRMVVSQGLRLSAIGVGVGLVGAFALTRVMRSMLVGVSPTDPVTFAGITALFLGVAALACWLPARRAARLDPLVALREE
ncbi:MAG TPA: ABC transporter permease [Gemmatimonadaceae bacterium]|nr:ABC transporter permease [Gemmatimonadaceae bacterium]